MVESYSILCFEINLGWKFIFSHWHRIKATWSGIEWRHPYKTTLLQLAIFFISLASYTWILYSIPWNRTKYSGYRYCGRRMAEWLIILAALHIFILILELDITYIYSSSSSFRNWFERERGKGVPTLSIWIRSGIIISIILASTNGLIAHQEKHTEKEREIASINFFLQIHVFISPLIKN